MPYWMSGRPGEVITVRRAHWTLAALALIPVLLAAVACGGGRSPSSTGTPPVGSGPPAGTSQPSPGQPGPSGTAPPGGTGGTTVWTSGPLKVERDIAIPPVPLLTNIRSATHPAEGYDRIVFDFQGTLPGYEVRYVSEVRGDPSDLPIAVPGRRFLLITFRPAQAHTDAGTPTGAPRSETLSYPMMKGYAIAGDFEAVLTVAIGVDDVVGYRVGELSGRIYLDVAA
jgi:hypothetical protein